MRVFHWNRIKRCLFYGKLFFWNPWRTMNFSVLSATESPRLGTELSSSSVHRSLVGYTTERSGSSMNSCKALALCLLWVQQTLLLCNVYCSLCISILFSVYFSSVVSALYSLLIVPIVEALPAELRGTISAQTWAKVWMRARGGLGGGALVKM